MVKNNVTQYWKKISNNPGAKAISGYAKKIIVAVIIIVIAIQLYEIGWREVLRSLPTQPLYYLLFALMYVTLPTAEVAIYKQVWKFKAWEGFKAFITKKVYNNEVMGYSGEFYLFIWARKLEGLKEKTILKNIRDNNILSAITSNLVAVVLIGVLFFTGQVELFDLIGQVNWVYVGIGVLIVSVLGGLIVQFRRYLFNLPFRKAIVVFGIYLFRFLIHHGLMALSWVVVIPDTPLMIWLIFLAAVMVVNRIPFVPSKDLIFVWFGIELSHRLEMATASVAGMLLVYSALTKITSLVLFSLISFYTDSKDIEAMEKSGDQVLPVDRVVDDKTDQK